MKCARRLLAPALAALALSGTSAFAQNPQTGAQGGATDNRALAETLFFTARGMMEAGRYAEACDKLTESYRLDPAAGTLLNLGVCHQKVGKIASAWGELRQSIADARKANRPDREKLATDAIATIEPELPFLTITVPANVSSVPGLVISRNGVPLNAAAWNTELPVDPGSVEVEERAPSYKPKSLTVTVTHRQHATVAAEPLELAPVLVPPPPYWTTRRTLGAVLLGAGVLAAGAGAFFGVQALQDKKNSDDACPVDAAGVLRCTQGGVDSMNSAATAAWISDISLGAAGAATLVGVYLFFTGGGREGTAGSAGGSPWTLRVTGGQHGASGLLTRSF